MSDLISKMEIISTFTELGKTGRYGGMCEWVIEIVKQLPPAELSTNLAEVGTDCISRQAAIDIIESIETERLKGNIELIYAPAIKGLRALPPAEPKRIRGKWIYCEDSIVDCVDGYRCDQCGFFVPWDYKHKSIDYIKDYNFCPKCGSYNGGENEI